MDFAESWPYLCHGDSAIKLQTSSPMKPTNTQTLKESYKQSVTLTESRIQALLELFWTANTESLWLCAEFCELSTEEQAVIVDEIENH